MENMSKAEALAQIGAVLARLPDSEIRDATNHLIGIINGMAIAGISVASYYNRYNAPQEFRLRELRCLDRIARRYGMSLFTEG